MGAVAMPLKLRARQTRDCTYHSQHQRIRQAPVIEIAVSAGRIEVSCKGGLTRLDAGESRLFYSNLGPVVTAATDAEVRLSVFDEALQ
jgi:ferric-dicitrate binding protein FerR (iron transport regulator)